MAFVIQALEVFSPAPAFFLYTKDVGYASLLLKHAFDHLFLPPGVLEFEDNAIAIHMQGHAVDRQPWAFVVFDFTSN